MALMVNRVDLRGSILAKCILPACGSRQLTATRLARSISFPPLPTMWIELSPDRRLIAHLMVWLLTTADPALPSLPPSVAATGSLSPSEPWSLMRGNVLRFIGLVFLCGFVLWILMAGTAIAIFSQGGLESIKALQSLDHQGSGRAAAAHA